MPLKQVIAGLCVSLTVFVGQCCAGDQTHDQRRLLVQRHWAGRCSGIDCEILELRAVGPYDAEDYRWGGYTEGFFFEDGTVQEYINTFCSDESDPARLSRAAWRLESETTLLVAGYYMTTRYRVLALSAESLRLEILDFQMKR